MIAIQSQPSQAAEPAWHAHFLPMLASIRRQAQIAFRHTRSEQREELVAEVVANCTAAYALLVKHGKQDVAFPSALARYGVAQVRAGRRVGTRSNVREILSPNAQSRKGFIVERLDQFDAKDGEWKEVLIEDRRATPADIAACRLDFSAWLALLPRGRRKIALMLAGGESTSAAAKKFRVTAARVSQLRRWLRENWEAFQGEVKADEQPKLAVT